MTRIDEQIEQALDRGDVESATMLAAQLESPQAYLDAMRKVHQIIGAGMKGELSVQHSDGTTEELGEFNLESPTPGQVPERVIEELRRGCRQAADMSAAFTDACKAQAEKYSIKPGALKRYIKALEGDKVEEVEKEAEDLQALIAGHEAA